MTKPKMNTMHSFQTKVSILDQQMDRLTKQCAIWAQLAAENQALLRDIMKRQQDLEGQLTDLITNKRWITREEFNQQQARLRSQGELLKAVIQVSSQSQREFAGMKTALISGVRSLESLKNSS